MRNVPVCVRDKTVMSGSTFAVQGEGEGRGLHTGGKRYMYIRYSMYIAGHGMVQRHKVARALLVEINK